MTKRPRFLVGTPAHWQPIPTSSLTHSLTSGSARFSFPSCRPYSSMTMPSISRQRKRTTRSIRRCRSRQHRKRTHLFPRQAPRSTHSQPPPTPSHLSPTGEPTLAPARGSIPVRLLLLMSLLCLLTLLVSLFLTVGAPEATVTLVPDSRLLSTALVVTARPHPQGQDIAARLLTASSRSRQASAVTTGQGYQPAQAAHGWLTFYNAAPYAQTVAAGTTLTAADGVSVVTEQAVRLPAGNPPVFGIAEVAAHAATTGPQGNIPALDLNGLCCLPGVSVKNTAAFVGGQA